MVQQAIEYLIQCLQIKYILALAMPEDALELSYIEVCTGTEYKELNQTLDTWNITTCPSK